MGTMNENRKKIEQRIERQMVELAGAWQALACQAAGGLLPQGLRNCGAELSRLGVEYLAAGGSRARFVEICHGADAGRMDRPAAEPAGELAMA
jgi:hypothetical protein